MTTIYHNPRCSKSRACFMILEDLEKDVEVINYIKNPFTEEKLKEVLRKLNFAPIDLIRKNEKIWKDQFAGKTLSDEKIINAMLANPSLIERPIIVHGNQAIIARPPEKVKDFLQR